MSDFQCQTTVKARVRHVCEQCHGPIWPGEIYIRTAHVFQGDFGGWKEHPECRSAWAALRDLWDLASDEGSPPLVYEDLDGETITWLKVNHPSVFVRVFNANGAPVSEDA